MVTECHAAVAAGRPVLEVEGVSPEVFEELLNTVRGAYLEQPLRPSPLATPHAARAAVLDDVDVDDPPNPTLFVDWRWLPAAVRKLLPRGGIVETHHPSHL